MSNIDPRLIKIFQEHFSLTPEEVNLDPNTRQVEAWDSLEHLKLILKIEKTFNVRFNLVQISQMTSLISIQNALNKSKNFE